MEARSPLTPSLNIVIEIDEEARREGLDAIRRDPGCRTWAGVVMALIRGVNLPEFLARCGNERVCPTTTVREYIEVLKVYGRLITKEGKTLLDPAYYQDDPFFQILARKSDAGPASA